MGEHLYVYTRNNAFTERMSAKKGLPFGVADGDYERPAISGASNFARGPYAVFVTSADLWRNESTGFNMFRFRIFHPQLVQYTDLDVGNVRNPVVSDGGGKIAFQSTGDHLFKVKKNNVLSPPLNADGNWEIFRMRGRRRVTQITHTQGCHNVEPSMDDDATDVSFKSTCDLVPGQNPNGVAQVFQYYQVKRRDPILEPGACVVSEGCCNEVNGCLIVTTGKQHKVTKKLCIDKSKGCEGA